ncbi:MAG TPA: hypothetical protein VKZ60_00960 [Chloroflexota bacterium]|nr:hypothetical protein [Chloroflexota bacterium]
MAAHHGRRALRGTRRGWGLFVLGVLLVAGGVLALGQPARVAPAVAAAVSSDGLAAKLLARDGAPAPPAQTAPVAEAAIPQFGAPVASAARSAARVQPSENLTVNEFFVHVPPSVQGRLHVLVALHGMGGAGQTFCETLLTRTDGAQWLVVAPTYQYGDWRDPNTVTREESARFIPRLHQFLLDLPTRTGLDLEPRAVLLGYSRGAQLAQRFAMVYPEQTRAVALISAGTYTLPLSSLELNGRTVRLPYPFGVADLQERFGRAFDVTALRNIPFWVGVGANDNNPADLPRQWDPYLGTTRVERAQAFARRLAELDVPVQLNVFEGMDHAVSDEVRFKALDFLASVQ